ncbi:MAG: hypothetical protein ACXVCE_13310 [Bacteriovorax sp.]
MNKMFLLTFFISAKALAINETVIVLEEITSRGKVINKDVVIVKDGSVIVNREKLSAAEIITQSEHMTGIASFKESQTTHQCESGLFKHVLKKGKVQKAEQGCLGSDRHKFLKENFRALKKDRVTE